MATYHRSDLAFPSTLLTATPLEVFQLLNDNVERLNAAFAAAGGNAITSVTLDVGDGSTVTLTGSFTVTFLPTSEPLAHAVGNLTGVSRDTPAGNIESITGVSLSVDIEATQSAVTSSNLTVQRILAGDDTFTGGAQNDMLLGLAGADLFLGGGGADLIIGDSLDAASYLDKAAGVVVFLNGLADVAVTVGGVNEDVLRGIENVTGGFGADTLVGDSAANILRGGAGADFIFGTGFNADGTMRSGGGANTLDGGDGADAIFGGDGVDTIDGGAGDDSLVGGGGGDTINGGADADFLFGGKFAADGSRAVNSGADKLNGGDGRDALYGFDGNDIINGDAGDDYVEGGEANDTINGGADNDFLQGQDGGDILNGGAGFDYLYGGAGADTFFFRRGDSADWILDFRKSEGDKLRLEGFGFAAFAAVPLVDLSTADGKAVGLTVKNPADGTFDQLTVFGVSLAELGVTNVLVG